MLQMIRKILRPSASDSLARSFARLGWIGFWIQIAIGAVPLALVLYAIMFSAGRSAGTRGGFLFVEYLTIIGLVVLAFTTIWSYRYTRLAEKIADPLQRPTEFAVQRVAWTGVAASVLGIVLSMLVMLFEVLQLLLYFLRAPQAGVPVIQTTAAAQASWISAADVINVMALMMTMSGEFIVLIFSLWLLFRTTMPSAEFPDAGSDE
jgi:hypothetical protein